jgi:hypothetical protein
MKDKMSNNEEANISTRSTILKLGLVCLICISLIAGLVYLIQFFTQ